MSVYVQLSELECRVPIEAYATLKGFLELNLSEDLGAKPLAPHPDVLVRFSILK